MKKLITPSILFISLVFATPIQVFAITNVGVKPGSFFYFFDTALENVNLLFTFNPEKKAQKALEYADERLAEIEAVVEEKNPNAVKTAVANYESNMALATEKSKEVKDKGQAETLLTLIAGNTSRNQEVLSAVLVKVPEEAREAITQAIEASRKVQEETTNQIAELKGEVEQLKQEVADLKTKDEERGKIIEELGKRKSETTSKPTPAPASIKPSNPKTSEATPVPKPITTSSPDQTKTNEPQVTQPPVQPPTNNTTNTTPTPTAQTQTATTIEISSVNVMPSLSSAQIEWQTNIPTNSKIFLSGGDVSLKVYSSASGLSTRHIVNATGLTSGTTYSYEIEAIVGDQVVKKGGSFSTKSDEKSIFIQADKTSAPLTDWDYVTITASYTKNGKLVPVAISFSAPDSALDTSKTYSIVENDFKPLPTGTIPCGSYPLVVEPSNNSTAGSSGGLCTSDGKVKFYYRPKTLGAHTVSISADGITKTFDIQTTEYVKIDPKFERKYVYQDPNADGTEEPVETPEYSVGYQNATIVNFGLSDADESFTIGEIKIESDIDTSKFRLPTTGSGASLNYSSILYQIKINDTTGIPLGTHTLTIKEIRVIGQKSGLYRTVTSLPLTFHFVIK